MSSPSPVFFPSLCEWISAGVCVCVFVSWSALPTNRVKLTPPPFSLSLPVSQLASLLLSDLVGGQSAPTAAADAGVFCVVCSFSRCDGPTHSHSGLHAWYSPYVLLSLPLWHILHTLTQRGSQWLWASEPGVWKELNNGAQRKSEEHRRETCTMPEQGEKPRGCLSLCLWSRSPLLLLGLFSLQQQANGKLQWTFSTHCCPQHFGCFYLGFGVMSVCCSSLDGLFEAVTCFFLNVWTKIFLWVVTLISTLWYAVSVFCK